MENQNAITVETTVQAPLATVWPLWTEPAHIINWYHASPDWHAPHAENDLRTGGKFVTAMAAKDGSAAFDFDGTYTAVKEGEAIAYRISDGRNVQVTFEDKGGETKITETFEAEATHPREMQREGWQAILNSFKQYAEAAQPQKITQKITPFLWFDNQAEEAMNFYTSVFKGSNVEGVTYYGAGGPMPAGTVMTASFRLEGQQFVALNGGPHFRFSPAVSFVVNCQTQEEIDYYWNHLSADPSREQCGWLQDKFGLSWQVVPTQLPQLLNGPDKEKSARAMKAMMQMKKLNIAELQQA